MVVGLQLERRRLKVMVSSILMSRGTTGSKYLGGAACRGSRPCRAAVYTQYYTFQDPLWNPETDLRVRLLCSEVCHEAADRQDKNVRREHGLGVGRQRCRRRHFCGRDRQQGRQESARGPFVLSFTKPHKLDEARLKLDRHLTDRCRWSSRGTH